MTNEQIIEMARKCGFQRLFYDDYDLICYPEEVVAFAKLVAEHERSECAKIVELNADACRSDSVAQMILYSNAAAIRARGEA
jgi:hypothetical protein